jgi:hypothetical protein
MFVKEVRRDLSEDEIREYSEQMAQAVQDLEAMKEGKREKVKAMNEDIKGLQDQIIDYAEKISNGYEMAPMDCEWRRNLAAGTMDMVVVATGEPLESRDMTDEEKQLNLEDAAA